MAAQWNPPPPDPVSSQPRAHEEAAEDDSIGDTVFSKAWVLSVLVEAVERVQRKKEEGRELEEFNTKGDRTQSPCLPRSSDDAELGRVSAQEELESQAEGGCAASAGRSSDKDVSEDAGLEGAVGAGGAAGREDTVEELEESLENDLCQLWDASMNNDVSSFLHQQKAIDILLGVASRSTAPRLTEICVGILGNMACQGEVCREGFSTKEPINETLSFLSSTDTRILYETTRLIATCMSHDEVRPIWLGEIHKKEGTKEALTFVLQSSASEELLRSTAVLLDLLLDSDEQLLRLWSSAELVEALCEAIEQTRVSCLDGASSLVMSLQLLSTIENGVACLVECEASLTTALSRYLVSLCGSEGYLYEQLSPLTASLSLLVTLSHNSPSHLAKSQDLQQTLQTIKQDLQTTSKLSPSQAHGDHSPDNSHKSTDRLSLLITQLLLSYNHQ